MPEGPNDRHAEAFQPHDDIAGICRRMRNLTVAVCLAQTSAFAAIAVFAWADPIALVSTGALGQIEAETPPSLAGRALLSALFIVLGGFVLGALVQLARAFSELAKTDGITHRAASLLESSGRLLLIGLVVGVLAQMPASAILSWNNPPGERAVSVTFGSVHLLALVSGGAFLGLARVLKRASALNDEMRLVV